MRSAWIRRMAAGLVMAIAPLAPGASAQTAEIPSARDWSGAYAGLQAGVTSVTTRSDGSGGSTVENSGEGLSFGLHGGFDHDFGTLVLGAALQTDFGDLAYDQLPPGNAIDRQMLLKLRAGAGFERVLVYGLAGAAWAHLSTSADSGATMSGVVYGIGMEYRLTGQLTAGAELREHHLTSIDADTIVTSDPVTDIRVLELRTSYRF